MDVMQNLTQLLCGSLVCLGIHGDSTLSSPASYENERKIAILATVTMEPYYRKKVVLREVQKSCTVVASASNLS